MSEFKKKGDLSNFELGMVVDARWVDLSISQSAQQSICEATTHTTLRWMGHNSRRPHWILQIGKRSYN